MLKDPTWLFLPTFLDTWALVLPLLSTDCVILNQPFLLFELKFPYLQNVEHEQCLRTLNRQMRSNMHDPGADSRESSFSVGHFAFRLTDNTTSD